VRVLLAGAEAIPFVKSGGLADVLGTLPKALAAAGHEVVLLLPLYGEIDREKHGLVSSGIRIEVPLGSSVEEAIIWKAPLGKGPAEVWFLDNRALYDRPSIYGQLDDAARFAFFSRAAAELFRAPPDGRRFDVLHANDWQAALAPVHVKLSRQGDPAMAGLGTVFTIHNLAYQGVFGAESFGLTGLSWDHFTMKELEFWGQLNFLKGGLVFADVVNTVSEKYAKEILTAQYGAGLEGVLAERSAGIEGVLNGVDVDDWNPETDRRISARFTADKPGGKDICREALLREAGLPRGNDVPLVGIIGRLAAQKGVDLIEARLPKLLERARVVMLGSGDTRYEETFRAAARKQPDRLSVRIGYDEDYAHRIEAGVDMILMPSAYEPCGLTQIYSLRYGAVPVVRATGGLDDTVVDADADPSRGNGFKFEAYDADALIATLDRAMTARKDASRWDRIRRNGMSTDFSWGRAAAKYTQLYELACSRAR